jgi:hypothetical protein
MTIVTVGGVNGWRDRRYDERLAESGRSSSIRHEAESA